MLYDVIVVHLISCKYWIIFPLQLRITFSLSLLRHWGVPLLLSIFSFNLMVLTFHYLIRSDLLSFCSAMSYISYIRQTNINDNECIWVYNVSWRQVARFVKTLVIASYTTTKSGISWWGDNWWVPYMLRQRRNW